jgi:hypothetical protein
MSDVTAGIRNLEGVIDDLLACEHPSIRYKVQVRVLGEDPGRRPMRALQNQIRASDLVQRLLRNRRPDGRIAPPKHVYGKWQGAHWIAAALADLDYPPGDSTLTPLRDQLLETWLDERFYTEFDADSKQQAYRRSGVPVMESRHRRCASQQSNALWSILKLGLMNKQAHELVERLLHWQWPDGGWNCDKNPSAHHASFMESVLPLRALALYTREFDDADARSAVARAAEIFLKRRLFLRQADGAIMKAEFVALHYPLYWHYDVLHGLKVMAECGFIDDPRCQPALELLASKQLPNGGWPAEKKYYRTATKVALGNDHVAWGPTGKTRMNPWTTTDALFVFRTAGWLDL